MLANWTTDLLRCLLRILIISFNRNETTSASRWTKSRNIEVWAALSHTLSTTMRFTTKRPLLIFSQRWFTRDSLHPFKEFFTYQPAMYEILSRGGGVLYSSSLNLSHIYRYVPPQGVEFLRRFGLKRGRDFAHFGLESDMVYEGTTVVYQCVRRLNSKWIRKKVLKANSKWILGNPFCCGFNLSNDGIISVLCKHMMLRFVTTPRSKNGAVWKKNIFGLK